MELVENVLSTILMKILSKESWKCLMYQEIFKD